MLLGLGTQQRQMIPSFESIDFKLSQNFLSSRNPSISLGIDYEPQSLTYTETEIDERFSMKFLELTQHDKQNKNHIRISRNELQVQGVQAFKNRQTSEKQSNCHNEKHLINKKMQRKKSILFINNIQLNCNEITDRSEEEPKRSNQGVFKRIQRKNSFSKVRVSSACMRSQCSPQLNKISESISILNNNSNCSNSIQNTWGCTKIKKKSISSMKTQDRSVIEIVTRSSQKQKLQRSYSQKTSCDRQVKKINLRNLQDRYSRRNSAEQISINRTNSKGCYTIHTKRKARKNFLEDIDCLEQFINVKGIKLEENTDVSRAYLRKIIQNRVSIQHYASNQINYQRTKH